VAPTEPLLEKSTPRSGSGGRRCCSVSLFFRGEERQKLEKLWIIEEKVPRNKQNVEAFEQHLHPY
jgi:hypothetical protein